MDWLSLSQVKELGVVVYNASHSVARAADDLFSAWLDFADSSPSTLQARAVRLGTTLTVPCWYKGHTLARCTPFSPACLCL